MLSTIRVSRFTQICNRANLRRASDRAATETMTDRPKPRGRRPKRRDVLDAGTEEFLEKGYAGTTLAMIAERAQVSTATVFKHFPTKADIFGAIMGEVFGNDQDALPPAPDAGDPRAGLMEIGTDYATLLADPKVRALFRVIIAEVPRFPELGRELYEKGKLPYLLRLKDYVEAEIAAGTLQVDDVDLAIRQFLGMINDVVFWPHMLVVDLEESEDRIRAVVDGAVDVIVKCYGANSCSGPTH